MVQDKNNIMILILKKSELSSMEICQEVKCTVRVNSRRPE